MPITPAPSSAASSGKSGQRRRRVRTELRVFVICILMLCALGGVVARLWWVQVARGKFYTDKIAGRSQIKVRLPSVRGEIRDRNGIVLVQNRASYEVDFYLPDMVRGYRQRNGQVPQRWYRGTVKNMPKDMREADIVQIVNNAVVPRLEQLDLAKDYSSKSLQRHFHINDQIPFTYLEDIDFPVIAKFSEHDVGLPGVDISVRPVRQYVYGAFASHLLGYVGMPKDIDREPDVKDYNFYSPDVDGKNQIEQAYDKYLRGTPGTRIMQRNVKGVIEGEVRTDPPKPGDNVYLTLDARIQYITEQALRHPALGRAAAVVIDPNNGDILAMGSIPSFDPNVFIPSISEKDWDVLNKDEAVPLVNRAVSGFPPGSTFKIVTALAGMKKHMAGAHYGCSGGVQIGDRFFHCWIAEKHGAHGVLGLADALKVSCDSYFYQYGIDAGIDSLDRIGKILGIGQRYDIGLSDEKEGVMPGPDWMKIRYPRERWSNAYTANVSIGQGYVLASPLQMLTRRAGSKLC
jgi:penicillin-binding protein 2